MKKLAQLSVAVLCLTGFANAANAAIPGYYVGAGVGATKLETPSQFTFDTLKGTNIKGSRQQGGIGGRIFAGYNVNNYFGLEAGYARYARSKFNSRGLTAVGTGSTTIDNSLHAFDLVGKAYLPLGGISGFNAYALGGVARTTSTVDYSQKLAAKTVLNQSATASKFRPIYGLGVSYDVPRSPVTTNLEFSRIQGYGNSKSNPKAIPNADMMTLNIAYKFD